MTFEVIAVVALIFAVLAFIAAVGCIAYTVGLRNSTHTIQWKPLLPEQQTAPSEVEELEQLDEEEPRLF